MHEHCAECRECTANAIEVANRTGHPLASSSFSDSLDKDNPHIIHSARVVLKGSEADTPE